MKNMTIDSLDQIDARKLKNIVDLVEFQKQ